MANRTVNTDQLQPDTMFLIRGKVAFSRIMSQIDGEELQEDIKRETQHGRLNPITKPYTKITVSEARVESVTPGPSAQALMTYAQESFYQSTVQSTPGANFRGVNKSPSLPWVSQNIGNGQLQPITDPAGELAPGLEVTLVMRVFGARQRGQHNGVSLDGVIVHEPVRYFTAANRGPSPELAAMGYTLVPGAAAPAAAPVPDYQAAGYQQPGPAPVAPPVGNAFSTQGAPGYPQGYQQPGPVADQPFGAGQTGPAPAPGAQVNGGVRYDPNAPAPRTY